MLTSSRTTSPETTDFRENTPAQWSLIEALACGWAALVLAMGMLAYMQTPGMPWQLKLSTTAFAIAVLVIANLSLARRKMDYLDWNRTGILFLCATMLATFWWAWHFDTVQHSDFGIYFRCGAAASRDTEEWISACQSAYLHKNLIYWLRSILYTAPLELVAGDKYFILKIYNAALHNATIALWFFGLRHYYGARIATIASVLFTLYPEWWFTTTLATTDNAALFFIVAFTLILPKLGCGKHQILVVVALAIILFAANLLRAVGPLLAVVLLAWVFIQQKSSGWNPYSAGSALIVLVLYALLSRMVGGLAPPSASDPLQLFKMFSTINFHSTQDFTNNYPWNEHFWFAIPEEWRARVAIDKIAVEFTEGFYRWPAYMYDKAGGLFAGSGYYGFSSFPAYGFNPDTVFTVPMSTVPFSPRVLPWLASGIFFLLIAAACTVVSQRLSGPALVSTLWLAAFAAILLGISEAQPRYSVLIAPALSLLAAIALGREDQRSVQKAAQWRIVGIGFIVLAVVFGVVVGVLHAMSSTRSNPLLFATAAQSDAAGASACGPQSAAAKIEPNYKRLHIVMPSSSDCTSIVLPLSESVTQLAFFVSGSKFPFLWEPAIESPYRYRIEIDHQVILDTSLGEKAVRWHLLDLPGESAPAARHVLLTVTRAYATAEDFIDVSLYIELKPQ